VEVEVKVLGLQELEARLQELGALAGQKLVRRILRKVAKPMQDQARAGATSIQRSGALARSIGIVNRKPRGQTVAKVSVTSRARDRTALWLHNTAYNRQRKGVFYGWMVDQGTVNSRARPWWTPAVNATEERAVSSFVNELRKAVEKIERRTGKTPAPDSLVTE
jgi:HK97 gp10 family phage protein